MVESRRGTLRVVSTAGLQHRSVHGGEGSVQVFRGSQDLGTGAVLAFQA